MPQDTLWLNSKKTDFILQERPVDTSTVTMEQPAPKPRAQTIITRDKFREESERYSDMALPLTLVMLAVLWLIVKLFNKDDHSYTEIGSASNEEYYDNFNEQPAVLTAACLTYKGRSLNFSKEELIMMLNKRSSYFTRLNIFEQERFINRVKKFISQKTFNIHDNGGFKEMPVLISAAAVQLSFGLENYLLPNFPVINIFPQEFLGIHPNIRFLEGNVSDNAINISWKHFLAGFEMPNDGQNVGLHEMSHAYYFQNLHCRDCEDRDFRDTYAFYELTANKVFEEEKLPGNDFYTEYAMRNFQEFWAESVEIYFEKPVELKKLYPELYGAISELLNQDMVKLVG